MECQTLAPAASDAQESVSAALHGRFDSLLATAESARWHLDSQLEYIAELKGKIQEMAGAVDALARRAEAILTALDKACAVARPPAAVAVVAESARPEGGGPGAGVSSAPAPVFVRSSEPAAAAVVIQAAQTVQDQRRPSRAMFGGACLVLGLAVFGVGELRKPRPSAPAVPPPQKEAIKEPAPFGEELGDADAALKLIYSYRLPGRSETLLDMLSGREETKLNVVRLKPAIYLLTFKPLRGLAPVYEFEADLKAGTVELSPETVQLLSALTP